MSKSFVFITGATGFIGSQVVDSTLRAGYRVRTSIRKPEQEAVLRRRFAQFSDDVETFVIPDLSKRESFKTALTDVDFVFHIASPMPGSGTDVQRDYVEPAVQATLSLLEAATEFNQIKKVVIVSSALALAPVDALISKSVTIKENTGEEIPLDLSMDFPEGFLGQALRYAASKIKAHQATREFLKNRNPHYTLITFHPVFVLGDSMIQTTPQDLDGMNALFFQSLVSEKPQIGNAWVHVRDVADAHVKALETDIKSGTEFLLSKPKVSWEDVARFVREKYPALGCKLQPPFEGNWEVETTAADGILGLKWRSEYAIVEDVVNQQLSLRTKASAV